MLDNDVNLGIDHLHNLSVTCLCLCMELNVFSGSDLVPADVDFEEWFTYLCDQNEYFSNMFMMKCNIAPYIAGGNSTSNYAAVVIYLSVLFCLL